MAEVDTNWEGGCLKDGPPVNLANQFPWYLMQRAMTCWEINQFEGSKIGLKYGIINDWIKEAGFRGIDFFDQLERIQIIELEVLAVEAQAREVERGFAESRKRFAASKGQSTGETLSRHHSSEEW
jgi:hypothetical protein